MVFRIDERNMDLVWIKDHGFSTDGWISRMDGVPGCENLCIPSIRELANGEHP
jgi:hypothetical protein